jgi:flavodoxin
MKFLVAYFSQTGNTKKVAEAIFEELGEGAEIKALADVESLDAYDLAFIGFPIMGFGPAKEAKSFLDDHAAGKRIALFMTHAALEDSEPLQEWLARCEEAGACAELVGAFDCQGELAEHIAGFLSESDDPELRAFAEARSETIGQPDATRLDKARAFAREMMDGVKG